MGNSYIRNFDILLYNMIYILLLLLHIWIYVWNPCTPVTYESYVLNFVGGFIKDTGLEYRGVFLGRNWDKNLKTFAPCYSQSPPPADFTPTFGILGLEIFAATAEKGEGLGFLYIISLFTYKNQIFCIILFYIFWIIYDFLKSSIVLSLRRLYLYRNTSFLHRNNN